MKRKIILLALAVVAVLCVGFGCNPSNSEGGVNGHTHVYSKEIRGEEYWCADATCLHGTVYYKSCEICGEKSENDTFTLDDVGEHLFYDKKETEEFFQEAATCKHGAYYYYACSECGISSKDITDDVFEAEEKGPHDFSNDNNYFLKEYATCKHGNIYYYACYNCDVSAEGITDETYDDGYLAYHNYTENAIPDCLKSAATCENKAVYYKSCSVCGEKSDYYTFKSGEPLGHDYSDWKSDGNGTHSKTCSHDSKLDHVITEKCCGGEASCTQKALCDDCKGEYGELAKHKYVENEKEEYLKTPATCTSRAVYYKSCSVCDAKGEETFGIGPFVHKYGSNDLCTECNAHKPTEGIIYEVENNEFACVVGVSDDMKETFVYLAKDYMGYPVTAIYSRFINDSVKSVYIPNSITKIGVQIFTDEDSIENLYIDSLESWCNIDFKGPDVGFTPNPLWNFDNLFVDGVKVGDELIIPSTVKEIKQSAFFGGKFKKITIPSSVEVIGKGAFGCCHNITEINIPNGVKTIKEQAFVRCSNLLSVTIPESLKNIEPNAFLNSEMLVEVINHSKLSVTVGEGESIAQYALIVHNKSNSIIEKDGDFIFITVNDSRYLLGYEGNLIRITLPVYGSNYVIYKNAMKNKKIVSVVIPDYVTGLPEYAFSGCDELVEVVDNGSRGSDFYYNDDVLSCAHKGESKIKKVDDYLFLTVNESTEEEQNYLIKYVGTAANIVLPESYNGKKYVIYKYAFSLASALTEVTVSSGVKGLYYKAFSNCTSLTKVTLCEGIEYMSNEAFSGCKNLTSIDIPDSVKNIDSHVFSNCTSLTEVTLGKGIEYIGHDAFSGCKNLTSIIIPDSVKNIGSLVFLNCTSLTEVTLGKGIEYIGYGAFSGCKNLTSIDIQDSVKNIGWHAFLDCTSLTEVTLGKGIEYIEHYAFSGCKNLKSIDIPDSVKNIDSHVFSDCTSLTEVTLGKGIEHIGNDAFSGCPLLKSINYNGTIEEFNKIDWEDKSEYDFTVNCSDGTITLS